MASKEPLHARATAAMPSQCSRMMFQPMMKAHSSPIVTYVYVYADPAFGTREPNSA